MPYKRKLEKKCIYINEKTQILLGIIGDAVKKHNIQNENLTGGDSLETKGIKGILLRKIGAAVDCAINGEYNVWPESGAYQLDPPAKKLLIAYEREITNLLLKFGVNSDKMTATSITSDYILVTEFSVRAVTIALCNDMLEDQDGDKILLILNAFIEALKLTPLFSEKKIGQDIVIKPFYKEFCDIHEAKWIRILTQMVDSIRTFHQHTNATTDLLTQLSFTKNTIVRHLILRFGFQGQEAELGERRIQDVFEKNEIAFLKKKFGSAQNTMTNVPQKSLESFLGENYWLQFPVLQENDKTSQKIRSLYQLLELINTLIAATEQIDMLFTSTGWILIIMGVLDFEKFSSLINKFSEECGKTLTIEDLSEHSEYLLSRYQGNQAKTIEYKLSNASAEIKKLANPEVIDILAEFVKGSLGNLVKFQEMLDADFIDVRKIKTIDKKLLTNANFSVAFNYSGKEELPSKKYGSMEKLVGLPLITLPGLKKQVITGDGHCLYRAVSLYLEQDVAFLRRIVAAHLEANLDQFREFLMTSGRTVEEYIEAIRHGVEWASHVEIEILMRVLNRPIVVVDGLGRIQNLADETRFSGDPIFAFYNGVDHYDALMLTGESSAEEVLERIKFPEREGEAAIYASRPCSGNKTDDPLKSLKSQKYLFKEFSMKHTDYSVKDLVLIQKDIDLLGRVKSDVHTFSYIVRIFDINLQKNDLHFYQKNIITMELADGNLKTYLDIGCLNDYIRQLDFSSQIAKGLAILHQKGILHLNLKDTNVLIFNAGGKVLLKISDFGQKLHKIGKKVLFSAESLSGQGKKIFSEDNVDQIEGSIKWIAPEHLLSEEAAFSTNSDIYSLALIFWRIFSGGANLFRDGVESLLPNNDFLLFQRYKNNPNFRPTLDPIGKSKQPMKELINNCWCPMYKSPSTTSKRLPVEAVIRKLDCELAKSSAL